MIPATGAGVYLWQIFGETGFVSFNGFGQAPLSFSEIAALQSIHQLNSNEAIILRQMSCAYLSGMKVGENPFGRPPWDFIDG